jgi:hypothetical protein
MIKRIIAIFILLLIVVACGGSRSESYEIVNEVMERGSDTQNIQFSQSQVLPPYGVKAIAEVAVLRLRVSTSQKDILDRIEDIQKAIDEITVLATENEAISLEEISVNQVSGSYAREESSASNIQTLDTSAITLKLTTSLSQHDYDFVKSVAEFNDFLNAINLPDTITIQALSVETELGELEKYRSQIITQIYQELDLVQEEYGRGIKFEITGLYEPLKKTLLSDIEYYLYLEPVVTVIEF